MTDDLRLWQPARMPARETIPGVSMRLEPLDAARHAIALATAFDDDAMWAWLPEGPFSTRAVFDAWLVERERSADPLVFAIVSEHGACGLLAFMAMRPEHGVIEIGHVAFAPRLQRTRAATEAVYRAARTVFETGWRRLEWKCNTHNAASQRAALRFGFTFEGIFRQHMVVKGRNRDTAWFSMLDHEWPTRRAGFERWLDPDNFDAAGRQKHRLNTGCGDGDAFRHADR